MSDNSTDDALRKKESLELEKSNTTSGDSSKTVAIDYDPTKEYVDSEGNVGRIQYLKPFIRKPPRKPYASFEEAPELPMKHVSLWSYITFSWIQPLIILGFQRPLEALDLWSLPQEYQSEYLSEKLLDAYARRAKEVELWNERLRSGEYKPSSFQKLRWRLKHKLFGAGDPSGIREPGLVLALNEVFFWNIWTNGIYRVIGDCTSVLTPLVTKEMIKFITQNYYHARGVVGYHNEPIGKGIGYVIGLMAMQVIFVISINLCFLQGMTTGVLLRGTLIASLYKRGLRLSGRARTVITNGKLVNHISTDVSRIDFSMQFLHVSWSASIQLIIVIVILLCNLGYSALPGIAFILIVLPFQSKITRYMFQLRMGAMVWTDKRVKLISELLGAMRIIKFFAWEKPYAEKVNSYRRQEMKKIRGLLISRAINAAIAMSLPVLATVISFVTYAGTGHSQNAATIFTSFTLFNLIRVPLLILPASLSFIMDGYSGIRRLALVFAAEDRQDTLDIEPDLPSAIEIKDGEFVWEQVKEEGSTDKKGKKQLKKEKKEEKKERAKNQKESKQEGATDEKAADNSATPEPQSLPLKDINLSIPRSQLFAITGPVGSGKTSLVSAMVGDMRQTAGSIRFGGRISYCPQQAWIQNATIRENILFGQPYDAVRYEKVVFQACLTTDLEMFPGGDLTQIGERGITLSGGQKQRINIARALYFDSDIIILDDPLSAVDAHVGKHLFDNAICGEFLHDKTRVLVTHALHVLHRCDYIMCMEEGRIVQGGTYDELIADSDGAFSRMMAEFGGVGEEDKKETEEEEEEAALAAPAKKKKKQADLMQQEERYSGKVNTSVYGSFFRAARGHLTFPFLLFSTLAIMAAQVISSYWLVWWQSDHFKKSNGFYMGMYAALGIIQSLCNVLMGTAIVFIFYNVSSNIHHGAVQGMMRAPMSFFDTNPLGRIINRFSKDIDTIDNTLPDEFRMALSTLAQVLCSVVLIAIVEPWFLLPAAVCLGLSFFVSRFYGISAKDVKRLDNVLRSTMYAHFSESLTGLSTIRAYKMDKQFIARNTQLVDNENRAYVLTAANQRWMGIRIDTLGNIMVFFVALYTTLRRYDLSPSKAGLALSYVLSIQQSINWMMRQITEVENDINSIERVVHYSKNLEREDVDVGFVKGEKPKGDMQKALKAADLEAGDAEKDGAVPALWPAHGQISFDHVVMSYRPGLPPVLRDLSLEVRPGEKIGVVGRTGAGKSSIMMSLFRIVELTSGKISIDGIDIARITLNELRSRIAIIPQDAILFSGTIRSNLDPFNAYDDAVLLDALKRSWLVDEPGADESSKKRLTLDSIVDDEGQNLSVGERSLVSLARALVKNSKIIVLDEATASVDYATDSKIQTTIRTEFKDKTLLCIAHRLRTIIHYDRVLVMDAGQVAEFDSPLALFRSGGIFRTMCDRSHITEEDILESVE